MFPHRGPCLPPTQGVFVLKISSSEALGSLSWSLLRTPPWSLPWLLPAAPSRYMRASFSYWRGSGPLRLPEPHASPLAVTSAREELCTVDTWNFLRAFVFGPRTRQEEVLVCEVPGNNPQLLMKGEWVDSPPYVRFHLYDILEKACYRNGRKISSLQGLGR